MTSTLQNHDTMKYIFTAFALVCLLRTSQAQDLKRQINQRIDAWHQAAADADYETYFSMMTEKSQFVGTDASENWSYKAFKSFSKPYFDTGQAWTFVPLERHVYINSEQNLLFLMNWLKM